MICVFCLDLVLAFKLREGWRRDVGSPLFFPQSDTPLENQLQLAKPCGEPRRIHLQLAKPPGTPHRTILQLAKPPGEPHRIILQLATAQFFIKKGCTPANAPFSSSIFYFLTTLSPSPRSTAHPSRQGSSPSMSGLVSTYALPSN